MSVEIDQNKAKRLLFDVFNNNLKKAQIALPASIGAMIAKVLDGDAKTYQYILFTGILAKAVNPRCHARSMQKQWSDPGAFDARSFCTKVVVPFEAECLDGKLGSAPDPFVNKPGRFPSVELSNATRGGTAKSILTATYDVLEHIQNDPSCARPALEYAIAHLRAKNPAPVLTATHRSISATESDVQKMERFLEANYGGEAAVSVTGAVLRRLYPTATITIHHVNQAGASSHQFGDIDLVFCASKVYAVEVKDKIFKSEDVDRSAIIALNRGAKKLIWVVGMHGEASPVNQEAKIKEWASKGLDLSFLKIADFVKSVFAAMGTDEWNDIESSTYRILDEMKASSASKKGFLDLFPNAANPSGEQADGLFKFFLT